MRLNNRPRNRLRAARAAAYPGDGSVSSEVLMTLAYSRSGRLQLEQRNHPAGLGLVFGEARRLGGDLREQLLAFRGGQFACGHVERVGADFDAGLRVGP